MLVQLLKDLELYKNNSVFFLKQEEGELYEFTNKETKKKLEILKPTAFYIFNDQPFILFFDLTKNENKDRESEIHKQVWSFDQSPLILLIKETEIEIFNAFSYDKKRKKLEKIQLVENENVTQLFSFWNLQSGNTWKWLQEKHYKKNIQDKRVNQKLFENIRIVRETLTNQNAENFILEDEANTLILRLIFIRYLIDRGVKLDETFIKGSTLNEKRKSFIELIEKPRKLNEFFEWLNAKFNGVLFKDIKFQLPKERALELALVFNGEIPSRGSLFYGIDLYFGIFDFSVIPVEIISGIYEALIDENTRKLHSAVYTPSFLVEYILTSTIDTFFSEKSNKKISEAKVFDPSVGSGIFLVQAFRRMVDREVELFGKVSKVRLREIAQNNLFGIDINLQSLKVTCFSIYIAILDYQDPKTILDNFHFPKLIDENLFEANFFDDNHNFNFIIRNKQLDFLLGNPPWKSDKDEKHINWLNTNNKVVGRFEIAQSFLLRSKDFMHSKTISALIVTSTIFYNISTPTKKFKQEFLKQFCISRFFDLSAVRRMIFEEKNSPCAIVFYKLAKGEDYLKNVVKHLSVKSNLFLKYYKTLVIEKFDQKEIQQKHFIENDWMFKVALYGNVLDFELLKKIELNKIKVIDLIDNKTTFKGAGIKSNKGNDFADFLIGLPIIENKEIENFYTPILPQQKVLSKEEVYYESGRKIELFSGSKILIKEQARNESELVISFVNNTCVFKNGIWGISSLNPNIIKSLYPFLISELYTYFIYITSCSWGVSTRPQIRLDEEYLSFPYIELPENKKNALLDLVSQFLKPYKKFYKEFTLGDPQKNEIIFDEINLIIEKLYDIKRYEKDLIDYVLDVSRYQFQESKQQKIVRKINNDNAVLENYADVFLNEFKSLYEGEYLQIEVYPIDHFIAMNFVFKNQPQKKKIIINTSVTNESGIFETLANNISISKISKDLYIQKDIKGFEKNSFYIIKPNEYKCWHRAMAWYDVAEIKKTIEEAEIIYLKNGFNA